MPRGLRRADLVKRHRHSTTGDKDGGVPEVIGCPVLDPIICQCRKFFVILWSVFIKFIFTAKDEIELGEGVKMTCTWESCPYSSRPLHHICYQLLEDNLVKRLASLGSARGWTVPQRRNNLWERKGQSLIGKFCRCRCDRGQMTRDKQALYEKEVLKIKKKCFYFKSSFFRRLWKKRRRRRPRKQNNCPSYNLILNLWQLSRRKSEETLMYSTHRPLPQVHGITHSRRRHDRDFILIVRLLPF